MAKAVIGSIGLVARPQSDISRDLALRALNYIKSLGLRALIERETAAAYPDLQADGTFSLEHDPPGKVVVIGGDGTLLRAGLRLGDRGDVVFLAVRAGKRGFLMDVGPNELEMAIKEFVEDRLEIVNHSRLRPSLRGQKLVCVTNDIVVFTREGTLVRLDIRADGERLMGIDGDGVVISTVTGSTAYSLNAGGPIIDPRLDVTVVTPLNPVQLYLRPVVISSKSILDVTVRHDSGPALLVLDGQLKYPVETDEQITITSCEQPLRVARRTWWTGYYERLYERLLSYW